MNQTNRFLNRTFLLVVGIVLVVVGAAAIVVMAWPAAAKIWTSSTEATRTWVEDAIVASEIQGTTVSWFEIAAVAAVVVAIVVLIVLLTRVGGGRSRNVVRATGQDSPLGRVTIRDSFVSDLMQNALAERSAVLSSSVSAHDVRSESVMQVAVTPRQNTSPREVVEDVDHLVDNLAALTGRDVPTYIFVRSGLRARLAADRGRVA